MEVEEPDVGKTIRRWSVKGVIETIIVIATVAIMCCYHPEYIITYSKHFKARPCYPDKLELGFACDSYNSIVMRGLAYNLPVNFSDLVSSGLVREYKRPGIASDPSRLATV